MPLSTTTHDHPSNQGLGHQLSPPRERKSPSGDAWAWPVCLGDQHLPNQMWWMGIIRPLESPIKCCQQITRFLFQYCTSYLVSGKWWCCYLYSTRPQTDILCPGATTLLQCQLWAGTDRVGRGHMNQASAFEFHLLPPLPPLSDRWWVFNVPLHSSLQPVLSGFHGGVAVRHRCCCSSVTCRHPYPSRFLLGFSLSLDHIPVASWLSCVLDRCTTHGLPCSEFNLSGLPTAMYGLV